MCDLIYLGVIGRNRSKTLSQAQRYAEVLEKAGRAEVLGPAPYPIARLNDEWRFRIALKAADGSRARTAVREQVLPMARAERQTRLVVNVEP
jgi:primosomal protein N'